MTREEGDLLTVGRHKRPMQMEALRLSVWGRDLAIIEDLMATALATRLEARHEGLGVYILDTDDWPSRCVHGYGTGTDTAMPGAGKTAFGVTLLHMTLEAECTARDITGVALFADLLQLVHCADRAQQPAPAGGCARWGRSGATVPPSSCVMTWL